MKKKLYFFASTLIYLAGTAQSNYSDAIQQGDVAFKTGQYKTAINKYFAAEAFDPSKKNSKRKSEQCL